MTIDRWRIAVAGVVLQIALGAVGAWSVFSVPLSKQFGWSISEVTLTFTICIFVLGFASFFGGLCLSRRGPRVVAVTGGLFYGAGLFLASFSNRGLWWLYFSHGVTAGIGLGLCNIVPITVLIKWFPDRRGLMTGLAVGGFGAGGVITAPVATHLIETVGVLRTFAYLGIAFLTVTAGCGFFMRNPPEGWKPAGWTPTVSEISSQ
jgi:OFA family oxalate/formate antiporter-like MFS transporter